MNRALGTQYPELFSALAAPLPDVKTRNQAGRSLKYVTARTVMNRLDEVLGPEGWWDKYTAGEHSVVCELTIRLPDGELLTKYDAGAYAGMADEGDDDKSGYSDAFKRAAVKFGVGRHLYGDGVPRFDGAPAGDRESPSPPRPAAEPSRPSPPPPSPGPQRTDDDRPNFTSFPRAGSGAVFHWFRKLGEHYRVTVLKKVEELAEVESLSRNFKDWDQETVNRIGMRAAKWLKQQPTYKGELDKLIGDGGTAGSGEAGESSIEGLRNALIAKAGMLWTATYPDETFEEASLHDMVAELSGGKVADYRTCTDAEALRNVRATVEKLLSEKRRR